MNFADKGPSKNTLSIWTSPNLRKTPITLLFIFGWTAAAHGTESVDQRMADAALRFYGRVNSASLLEPASSHGSIGTDFGAGLVNVTPPEQNALLALHLGETSAGTSLSVPRVWLVHGLPLPIDGGITAAGPTGNNQNSGFMQLSAALQWTVYQAFARPALAVRASYGKLFGITGMTVTSVGGEAVLDYAVLRFFTFYGRLGVTQHQGTLSIAPQQLSTLGLTENAGSLPRFAYTWSEPVQAAGLRLRFGTTRLALTGEADLSAGLQHVDYGAKLSYDL